MNKRLLIINSGGDCPGMNAVIWAIVKRATKEDDWEVIGSINGFDGILSEPFNIEMLDRKKVSGIHVKGGTILKTNNKRNPFSYPVLQEDGKIKKQPCHKIWGLNTTQFPNSSYTLSIDTIQKMVFP